MQWKRLRNIKSGKGHEGEKERTQYTFHMCIYGTVYVGCLLQFPFLFIFYLSLLSLR